MNEENEITTKPRLVISPMVQKIQDLPEKTLDKFIRDYGIQVKITKMTAIRGNTKQP